MIIFIIIVSYELFRNFIATVTRLDYRGYIGKV